TSDDTRWQSGPLPLTAKDGRWYGLGTCDMKGFFPLAIEAAKAFVDQPLQQPLIILATADEESSMNGARALAEAGKPKARYAVIGEDRKSTRLNSSHVKISYAVFCLKKKTLKRIKN